MVPTSFRERPEDEKKIKKKMQKNVPEAYCAGKIKKQGKRRTGRANGKLAANGKIIINGKLIISGKLTANGKPMTSGKQPDRW